MNDRELQLSITLNNLCTLFTVFFQQGMLERLSDLVFGLDPVFHGGTTMNSFRLRLFSPNDDALGNVKSARKNVPQNRLSDGAFEDIIPIDRARRSVVISGRFMEPADRARVIQQNNCCPACELHDIEPLELSDALISPKNRLPVPGTATIVGFHCNDCGTEWPVYELSRRKV